MKSWLSLLQFLAIASLLLAFWFLLAGEAGARGQVPSPDAGKPENPEFYLSPTNGLGSWIWSDKTFDQQYCRLWNSFVVPDFSRVVKARLVLTADNEFTLYLDGRELGRGDEWRELFVFDLTQVLTPGKHIVAIKAFNSSSFAGVILGLHVDLADGRILEVKSDASWRIVPAGVKHWEMETEKRIDWPEATVMAPLGGSPWWTRPENINVMSVPQPIKVLFWQTGWFQITLLSLCGAVIVLSLWLMAQLTRHQKEHRLLRQERARIAREIHDDIGSRMTQLVLHGEVAQSGPPAGSQTQQQLIQICEEARGLLSTMDEILWAVNPRRDTLRDFAAYVCNYAEEFLEPTPIQCLFEVDPEMLSAVFTLPVRRSLLMAIKETLNNAVKHSAATELRLQIQWHGPQLVVVVQDNGQGFDPATIRSGRNGLTNMAQRLAELGGRCLVTSQPGRGCRVEFSIPLRQPRRPLLAWIWHPRRVLEPSKQPDGAQYQQPVQKHDPTQC